MNRNYSEDMKDWDGLYALLVGEKVELEIAGAQGRIPVGTCQWVGRAGIGLEFKDGSKILFPWHRVLGVGWDMDTHTNEGPKPQKAANPIILPPEFRMGRG